MLKRSILFRKRLNLSGKARVVFPTIFGQFYRTVLGDLTNARKYLERSLEQENNSCNLS